MPDLISKPVPIPRAVDSRGWSSVEAEQPPQPRSGRAIRSESLSQHDVSAGAHRLRSRATEDLELGMAELQRIMQGNPQKGHTTGGFYGMSPPTRTTGAANPLGLDSAWRNTAYKATHSNLQALREMSVPSCLRNSANGDILCIPESPDCGFLSAEFEVFDGEDEDNRASPASCMTHY